MKVRGILKRGVALAAALMMAISGSIYAAAEVEEKPIVSSHQAEYTRSGDVISGDLSVDTEPVVTFKSLVEAISLPSSYSSKDMGYVERVEDQGSHGLCWSFTQNTLAAVNVKKDEGKSVNYSETHMGYSLSSECGNELGFERKVDAGGNCELSIAYINRGSGLVAEGDDPYITTTFPYRAPSATDRYFSTGYLEEAIILHYASVNEVKELIYEYGAAGTSIYYDDAYYNASSNYYYCPYDATVDHAITLIGWNDSYGCFLAMNSWGSSWGNGGTFWISYYDQQVRDLVFSSDYKSGDLPYDGLRSYNDFGYVSYANSGNDDFLFYSTTYDTGDARTLEGIGTYTVGADTKLEIYVNPYNGDGKANSKFKLVHTQTFEKPGYYHISFADPVYLYGDQFNVKIKATSLNDTRSYAPIQMNINNYLHNCVFQEGRTYYGVESNSMWLMEELDSVQNLQRSGWGWAMQAFTNSDLSMEIDQAKVTFSGEAYQVTLSKISDKSYSITRNGATVPLYTDYACTAKYTGSLLMPGTYYMMLGNGTHIRRRMVVSQSNASVFETLLYVNGERPDANNSFTFNLSGKIFAPTVDTFFNDNWALYALPGGVGRIGKSMTLSLYRTVVYLRIVEGDGITVNEYPITLYGPISSASGYSDWNQVSGWALAGMGTSVQNGLINGNGGKLNPKGTMSRAEAATILLRAAGIESSKISAEYALAFADVKSGDWFAKAVGASSMIGMVDGHTNAGYRAFSPTGKVTREQYAVMMIRLLAYLEGEDVSTFISSRLNAAKLTVWSKGYADTASISPWAKDAVYVALYLGVFSGANVGGKLYVQPQNNITREQAALMMHNSRNLIY